MYGSWWHSFVGNVMGTRGRMSGWIYEDPGTPGARRLPSGSWATTPFTGSRLPTPWCASTVLREGNFDYVTNQVHWDTSAQTIPPSLYLTGKPAFFGSLPWPWVDPTGTTKLHTLPPGPDTRRCLPPPGPYLNSTRGGPPHLRLQRSASCAATCGTLPYPHLDVWHLRR